ncbi:NUDIX domain-containing protein [Nonomuraea sp. NPDC050536]|uniref:NUDIX domain-containing protein n=1 Tax=Nonomuraea sp. NPDC050536 TaxID=3364366 RepID=UPI0037CB44D5
MSVDDFWSSVHRVVTGAGAYITDERGRALLVKPNYRDHWSFTGGIIDEGEHPAQACAREIGEEIGLDLPVGQLLTVQWSHNLAHIPYALVNFMFDCGTIPADTPIRLQAEELDDYGFFSHEEAKDLMIDFAHDRLLAAARARQTGELVYLPPAEGGLIG